MDSDGREVLLHQQLRESHAALHRLHKDHHLQDRAGITAGTLITHSNVAAGPSH